MSMGFKKKVFTGMLVLLSCAGMQGATSKVSFTYATKQDCRVQRV